MNWAFRYFLCTIESLFYGPGYGAINLLIRNPEPLDPEPLWKLLNPEESNIGTWLAENYPPRFMRRFLLAAKMKQDHLLGISAHYDVSNDFYKMFLDTKYMFYTCADFHSPDDSLEQAQTNKAEFILRLIDPKPGEKILDLGCGWGPMMKRIYEETGDQENLYGYTLSQKQVDFVKSEYGFNIEFKNFITCEYADNLFDKVFSIGSWEHVRHRDLQPLVNRLYRAIKPGGRMVKHFFSSFHENLINDVVIAQLFFPGSYQPSHELQVAAFESAGFHISHRSIHDYRPTLRAWFDNLVNSRDEAIELVGLRTYNKYLTFFAVSYRFFDCQRASLIRYVLEKPS